MTNDSESPFFQDRADLISFLGYVRHRATPQFTRRTAASFKIKKLLRKSASNSKRLGFSQVNAWLMIADEFAEYLFHLHFHLLESQEKNQSDLKRAILALIGGLSSEYMAVRQLVVPGFDGPARTVLRALVEKTETICIIIDKPDLVAKFLEDGLDERTFWFKNVRAGRGLRSKVALLKKLDIFDDEVSRLFWEARYKTLDPFKHSNHEASGISMLVFGSRRDIFTPGMLGIVTDFSVDTLSQMIFAIAEIALIFSSLTITSDPLDINLSSTTNPHRRNIVAFHSIVLPMWEFIVRHRDDPLLRLPDEPSGELF